MRILLIEDDPMIGAGLVQALDSHGMTVDWVTDAEAGELAIDAGSYALILLDLGLPAKPGTALLRDLRARGDKTPLLILTARETTEDRVAGLDLGADDYLVKPFEVSELLARMRAVLRRNSGHATSVIGNGRLTLDLASHEAACDGLMELLPAREFTLLHALLERPGTILSRTQLEERVYGWGQEVASNAIEVLIHSVRKKLGKDVIRNVRGAGWLVDR
jgi:DNA-binding response OmpR family regulator